MNEHKGDLIGREAAINLLHYYGDETCASVVKEFENIPAVDAVEVVRCKDCLYRSQYCDAYGMYHCGGIDTTKVHSLPIVGSDFFCAHGERRDNGKAD